MKHKTSDLEGALLDAAVALAEGRTPDLLVGKWRLENFAPSTDWQHGGPIIQREQISFAGPAGESQEWQAHCRYAMENAPERLATEYGPTQLIAAMRAFVKSRLGESGHWFLAESGEEVDLP